jgi:uncharacterized protein (DUF2141 family)
LKEINDKTESLFTQNSRRMNNPILQYLLTKAYKNPIQLLNLALIAISAIIVTACANIQPPTGGPEDTKAPEVTNLTPPNNSTNFKGNTIVLEFDEFVEAPTLREKMIISPIVEGEYDILTRKKVTTIKFVKGLEPNTTYSINFGDAIKDVTKGNFAENITLAFSTGPIIDSLYIKGRVVDFVKETGLKDISVQLYKSGDTATIQHSKPMYLSKTDVNGNFTIKNIKQGTYHLYALEDQNKNYKYDNEKERIAYLKDIAVDSFITNLSLGLTRIDTKAPNIFSKKQEYDYQLISLSEGVEQYNILHEGTQPVLSEISDDRKKLKVFNNFDSKDSITLYFQLTDSAGNQGIDTLKVLFEEYKDRNNKNPFTIVLGEKTNEVNKNQDIKIRFSKPAKIFNPDAIKIKADSLFFEPDSNTFSIDSNLMGFTIQKSPVFKDSLILTFEKGAFISLHGDSSTELKSFLRLKNEENFGILGGTIETNIENYIFQLLDDKDKIIHSEKNIQKFYYTWLSPGSYQLRLLVDLNGNGRWDSANLVTNQQPEPIIYFKEKVNLRANWEILDIKFVAKPQ